MGDFTLAELERMTREQLARLASYYKIEISSRTTKSQIIEKLFDTISTLEKAVSDELPPMSVRIKRIHERSN